MVIAGLAAQGTTEIDGVYHIERGYETLVEKLSGVGAKIQVLFLPDDEAQTQEMCIRDSISTMPEASLIWSMRSSRAAKGGASPPIWKDQVPTISP